ncbi:helix-turn-helix domain-containing protein [Marmoricola sp. URHB0036]|uniref:helix-turn-helix domain-containing protein n=1 Tax=Marmoricola sp. URHB0036 TaxID=1298863 RepID=UPI0018CA846D|nr:helix-turn-helix domain-containing protein [Marmoricola sp. URHB0036]
MGVSVRHNSKLAAAVALAAAVLAVVWFSRALQTGSVADWAWCLVVTAVGVLQLLVVRDSRAPLMVADEHGVRVRRGVTWSGLPWQDIENVEVTSPRPWLRDGRIVVQPRAVEGPLEAPADQGDDSAVALTAESFVVPLGLTTRLEFDGLTGDLVADLDALASGRVPVLVVTRMEPEKPEKAEKPEKQDKPERLSRKERAGLKAALAAESEVEEHDEHEEHEEPEVPEDATKAEPRPLHPQAAPEEEPFDPVEPAREARPAARNEVIKDSVRMLPTPPPIPAQRAGDGPVVVARVDDYVPDEPRPADNAVIGPLVAAARHRARLSIDTLSERTRIRPHVLECIEVDDFAACGGDFYARGHLRTLARVFGLDAQQLLDLYDEHYATAEIEARQVFEAELATGIGGGVRAIRSGPRWSLLAACVLALATVWGVARVFNDTPQELVSPAPGVVDSAGLASGAEAGNSPKMTLAPLEVSASGASPQVVVRDRDGRILWAGKLADGQHQQVIGLAPFDVTASNGSAVKVSFLSKPKGTVGDSSAAASKTFGQSSGK